MPWRRSSSLEQLRVRGQGAVVHDQGEGRHAAAAAPLRCRTAHLAPLGHRWRTGTASGASAAETAEELRRCVAELREQVAGLRAGGRPWGRAGGPAGGREAGQARAGRTDQLVREAARQERARTFERSLGEQARLLRELFQQRRCKEEEPAVSVFTTTPPDAGGDPFAGRYPLISERLRNISWRRTGMLDQRVVP